MGRVAQLVHSPLPPQKIVQDRLSISLLLMRLDLAIRCGEDLIATIRLRSYTVFGRNLKILSIRNISLPIK